MPTGRSRRGDTGPDVLFSCCLALRADVPPKVCDFRRRKADIARSSRAYTPAHLTSELWRHPACARARLRPPSSSGWASLDALIACRRTLFESRWRGPESNRRHHGFQPCALPTELPRRGMISVAASAAAECRRPEPGFARREATIRWPKGSVKEGVHGGTMGSPVLDTTVFRRVLYQLSYLAAG
jgi:hypothetical protein